MSLSQIVRALVDAGATPAMILAAVEAAEGAQQAEIEKRRAGDAERQRRRRDRIAEEFGHVTSCDVTGQAVTERDPSPPPSFPPEPPKPPTPTPDVCSTRTPARLAIAKPNGFARFWEAYPNKVGKAAAEKAYAAACRKIDGPDPPSLILAGVERARSSRSWIDGYIPHPTTWLNQGRWDDQPAEIIPITAESRPHGQPAHSAKLTARMDNLARAFAGSEAASRRRAGDG